MVASHELRTVLSPLLSREEPLIWITENSYVCLNEGGGTVEDQRERQFTFSIRDTDEHALCLSIHSSTVEEAIICLDYLVGHKGTLFEEMNLTYKSFEEVGLCPFGADTSEKMLQISARRVCFISMIFTSDHCRTLATSGTKTDIEFYGCDFQDEGVAFVEASAARQDETSGPAKLRFLHNLPFNDRNWALFLSQHKLESLDLCYLGLNSEVSCRAMATAEVRCLTFEHCNLEDGGAALVESVRQGRGPRELRFLRRHPFDSSERAVTCMNALRGNTYLERLELWWIDDYQFTQALAAALRENKGLVQLSLSSCTLDQRDRTELLKAITLHPSLRSLHLEMDRTDIRLRKRRECIKAVADMLSVNDRVEVISDNTIDKGDWDTFVAPRLECNKYRTRFPSIQKIEEASTRAAVLARALAKFAGKPHLVLMLLNQNHDVVSSYLDLAHDRNSIPL
jgi:hypothetical protein